jgi:hypothetical protein
MASLLWFAHGSHALQEALSAAMIALEISSAIPASRRSKSAGTGCVPARSGPRPAGADMVDIPACASGLLVRDSKKEADRLVTRTAPGVVSLVCELRGHERQTAGNWPGRPASRSARSLTPAGGDYAGPVADRRGVGLS